MATVQDVFAELTAALETVDGLRVYQEPSGTFAPPAVVFGAPSFVWGAPCAYPSEGTLGLYVITAKKDRMRERLMSLLPQVAAAIEDTQLAVIRTAEPVEFGDPANSFPAYFISLDIALGGA